MLTRTPRYAAQCALPLFAVLAASTLIGTALLRSAQEIGAEHGTWGLVLLAFSVIASLVGYIVMLQVLASRLLSTPEGLVDSVANEAHGELVPARAAASLHGREDRVVDAIAASILPFLIFYGAWGLTEGRFGEYFVRVIADDPDSWTALSIPTLLVLSGVSFMVRALFEWRWRKFDSAIAGILAAICEGLWMVFALFAAKRASDPVMDWIGERRIIHWLDTTLTEAANAIGDVGIGGLTVGELLNLRQEWSIELRDALFIPIVWLVIGLVVLARDLEHREGEVQQWRVIGGVHQRMVGLHPALRPFVAAYGEFREKLLPLLIGLRAALHAGPVLLLAYCAVYGLLVTGSDWLARGVFRMVGSQDAVFWNAWLALIELPFLLVTDVLRLTLVAVATSLVLEREWRLMSPATVSDAAPQ